MQKIVQNIIQTNFSNILNMKQALKYFVVVILVIIVLLILTPIFFKGKISLLIQDEISKNVKARVEFTDVRLTLFRNFPDLTIFVKNLGVIGTEVFENDTLVSMKNLRLTVELMSLIRGGSIGIKSVVLENPVLHAKVLEDGRANWDIMIDTYEEDSVAVAEEESSFVVALKNLNIRNGKIVYNDASLAFYLSLEDLNAQMKGDLTLDFTTLEIESSSKAFSVEYEGVRYINRATLEVNTILEFGLERFKFSFKEASANLNALELGFDGWFEIPEEDIEFDLRFYSRKTDFKTILSLIPAIYTNEFQNLKTSGNLSLKGFAKGTYGETTFPDVGIDLLVENGMFQYPGLPASVKNVSVAMNLFYDGTNQDNTTFEISRFQFEMAGNPFNFNLSVRNPFTVQHLKGGAFGKIDFSKLTQVVPLEGVELKGVLETNLSFNGMVSDIEKGNYEAFDAKGKFQLAAFEVATPELPYRLAINSAILELTPRFVALQAFEAKIGESDLRISGSFENFIPYAVSGKVLTGNMNFSSNLMNLNQLMSATPAEESTDTTVLKIIEIPKNIDFTLASVIGQINYGRLNIENTRGIVRVYNGKVLLDNLTMNLLKGQLNLTGEYNTQEMTKPFVNLALDISNFELPAAFEAFNTIQKLAPIAQGLGGSFSARMNFSSKLSENMMPVLSTANSTGSLSSSSVQLVSVETFDKISSALRLDESKSNLIRDLNLNFNIKNGKVVIDPFDINLRSINMKFGGEHNLDQTINYSLNMIIPRDEFGVAANEVINNLVADAAARGFNIQPSEKVNVNVKIGGTLFAPEFSLNMADRAKAATKQLVDQVQTQIKAEADAKIEEAQIKIREELSERAQKIIQDAERLAAATLKQAEEAAQVIRAEAAVNAARIEKEAEGKNPLAQRAAKTAADRLRKNAEESALKLISEAQQKSDAIIKNAKIEAEKLQ